MQHHGVGMVVQVVSDLGIKLCATQCDPELIKRRKDTSVDSSEVVIDTRDGLCGKVIAQDRMGQSTLTSPKVEHA